ncbi:description family protein [Brucella grignonensis]|uniref:DNA 3'-5' helicase II n=1 Tax=Brucella grignonensis TaxID=94627 RepID=A0A256F2X9_9HYPH|nr:description family protein [Brucella grignonensis]
MQGRRLLVTSNVITYAPVANIEGRGDDQYPICNNAYFSETIDKFLGHEWESQDTYLGALSVIQSISTIRRNKRSRIASRVDSRGSKLKSLEESIANLDVIQGRAVIETVDGVQRIRGLAGSGKTVILALKAAYLHAQHPEWKIAVTFNTRSLKEQFRRLITTLVIEQSGEEPIWDNLQILNAWGAPGGREKTGMYYMFCQRHGISAYDFQSARRAFGQGNEFNGVCTNALQQMQNPQKIFDAILIDEAQDFESSFLQLCYWMLGDIKRLVYAYDELQSLTERSLPPPEEIFGSDERGRPRVQLAAPEHGPPQQDIILEKCYRNSGPVLATAHALGFGIYRDADPKTGTGLVQMFENNNLWLDVGYRVKEGELVDNSPVRLMRTAHSSPQFLQNHSPINDLIQFIHFDDEDQQANWLANSIQENLTDDELACDDIIVINPAPLSTRSAVGKARRILFEKNINSHLAGVDTSPDVFFDEGNQSVAFTGIFRAKGNEAGMVYIMNAQDCYTAFGGIARVRNRLFTAITRSKAWVRVLGIGENMRHLEQEFQRVQQEDFELAFVVPDDKTRKSINIINRDMTDAEKKNVKDFSTNIGRLIEEVRKGELRVEDLPNEQIEQLRKILGNK